MGGIDRHSDLVSQDPLGILGATKILEGHTTSQMASVLNGKERSKEKSKKGKMYLSKKELDTFRAEFGPFLEDAYKKIKSTLQPKRKKKVPWQRILSSAIAEWNEQNPGKAIASYYTRESWEDENSMRIWEKDYGIKTIKEAFVCFGMGEIDLIEKRKYLSKDEVIKSRGVISKHMQEYIRTKGVHKWKPSEPWHHRVSKIIGDWNRSNKTMMIYNYMHKKPGEKTPSKFFWLNEYGIEGKDEVLGFLGISL